MVQPIFYRYTTRDAVYSARAILFLEVHDEPSSSRMLNNTDATLEIKAKEIPLSPEEKKTFAVYPNPSTDQMYLKGSGNWFNKRIEIFDAIGKKVFDTTYKDKIEIKSLDEGIYIIKVIDENKIIYKTTFVKIKN